MNERTERTNASTPPTSPRTATEWALRTQTNGIFAPTKPKHSEERDALVEQYVQDALQNGNNPAVR